MGRDGGRRVAERGLIWTGRCSGREGLKGRTLTERFGREGVVEEDYWREEAHREVWFEMEGVVEGRVGRRRLTEDLRGRTSWKGKIGGRRLTESFGREGVVERE